MKFASRLAYLSLFCVLSACGDERDDVAAAPPAGAEDAAADTDTAPANLKPAVLVHKSSTCGCCRVWIDHMQSHGFPVKSIDDEDIGPIKERLGVPYGQGSCHTAEVEGYFIEGHVPANEVERLLAEKPKAKGLTVPGMPIGSPGMEVPGVAPQSYNVFSFDRQGQLQ
ncbi:MAG: DUF411 domain-containing protein, partial [Steroidobacteraceae bacterium]